MILSDNLSSHVKTLTNFAANGSIGTAATTVDKYHTIFLTQTTANIVLTLPNPTLTTNAYQLVVANNGTIKVTVNAVVIDPNDAKLFQWNGTIWIPLSGAPPSDFWRSGITAVTLPDGTNDTTDGIVHNGNIGIGANVAFTNATTLAGALDVSGAEVLRAVALPNFAASGSLGTAATTVNVASTITIAQTTANVALTIPVPSITQAGRVLVIANIGTAQLKVDGIYITPGTSHAWVLANSVWSPLGDLQDAVVLAASRNALPTDHLKTLLASAARTLTIPSNVFQYALFRVRQTTAAGIITVAAGAGMTLVAPYGAATVGLNGASNIVEVIGTTIYVA